MAKKYSLDEPIKMAAVALLHREIVRHGQVILTQADFDEAEAAEARGQAIQLTIGVDDAVVFTHVKADRSHNDA